MYKKLIYLVLLFIGFSCSKKDVFTKKQIIDDGSITPLEKCENGFAGIYPCNDYDLLTHISLKYE